MTFNPIKLASAAVRVFARGLKWDRLKTDADIMRINAVGLLRVYMMRL